MSVIRESSNFTINRSVLNNIQGNATILRFGDGTLTRSEVEDFMKDVIALPDIGNKIEKHSLIQSITSLPRAEAAYKDYQSQKKNGLCFKGTREALLGELGSWLVDPKMSRIYVLSGLAGIGKSIIAHTFASRADALGMLGASFFFSKDEFDRKTAKKLFTTIAFQLCVFNKSFAQAIGDALLNERGSAAVTVGPNEQLETLILEPLRDIVKSRIQPTVIVIDALDECNDRDAPVVLASLERLVHNLPGFKVLLTTRPQPHLDHRLSFHDIFRLQNIEDKIINNDIRLYLKFSLSWDDVSKCLPGLISEWNATDEEIEYLVTAAGKLFIIASTVVRLILDTTAYNPGSQMQLLLAHGQLDFNDLESFYIVILRRALPEKCSGKIVERFKTVIGAILFVQEPLPVTALQHLTFPYTVHDIDGVLKNLKSVITDEHNIPHIYHKSFSDFLIHKHSYIRVISEDQHKNLATRCFKILNKHLRQNVFDLTGLARFMDNTAGLKRQGISNDEFRKKITLELDYACRYWSIHLEGAAIENFDCVPQDLVDELSIFANEHLLHWIETMSWVCKLDLASRALLVVHKLLCTMSTSTEMRELFSDALRFISKFYSIIQRSALHTYHSALSRTPTETLLYKRYNKGIMHNVCQVQGVPENWDNLIAFLSHGEDVTQVVFSQDSSMFASLSRRYTRFWDTNTGAPIGRIIDKVSAIADDFSKAASHNDCAITLYDLSSCTSIATFNVTPASIAKLVISPDGCRLAAGLSDGTVCLWNWRSVDSAVRLDQFAWDKTRAYCCLTFNSSGDRLAFGTDGGIVLRNGISGEFIADMKPPGKSNRYPNCVAFSRNGSRLAYGNECHLSLWNGKNGALLWIAELKKPGHMIAISDDGTLIAIDQGEGIMLWSLDKLNGSNCLKVVKSLKDFNLPISSIAFQPDGQFAIYSNKGTGATAIYDVKDCSFIFRHFGSYVISPDKTRVILRRRSDKLRLAVLPKELLQPIKGREGRNTVKNIATLVVSQLFKKARAFLSQRQARARFVTILTFSPDCLRLTSCYTDGTIDLWDTSCSKQLIATLNASSVGVESCVFSADGSRLASGSFDGIVKLWNGRNGARLGTLKPKYPMVTSMVFLCGMLVVRSQIDHKSDITLWNLKTLRRTFTVTNNSSELSVLFHHDTMLIYYTTSSQSSNIDAIMWDVEKRTPYATISMGSFFHSIEIMVMSPDKSKLIIQLNDGNLKIFDLPDGCEETVFTSRREDLDWDWLPQIRLWHGFPVWCHRRTENRDYWVSGYSSHDGVSIPVLWIEGLSSMVEPCVAYGSSMFALAYNYRHFVVLRQSSTDAFD